MIDEREEFVIKDLETAGESFVAARGGKGGRGNAHFKSAVNQAPRHRTLGEEGEQRRVVLELKTLTEVPRWVVELIQQFDLVRGGNCKYSTAIWEEALFRGTPNAAAYAAELFLV